MKLPTRPHLLSPSTRAFIAEARRVPGYRLFDLLHGYVYARWPYLYIAIGTGEHRLAKAYRGARELWRWVRPLLPAFLRREKAGASLPSSDRGMVEGEEGARTPITFADTYHGKVVTLAAATSLVKVEQEIALTGLEHIIPYALARDIVLKHPDHIVVLECPCRAARPNPCRPLDVCLIVGEPFASFVLEHHGGRSRRITSEEAVEILRAEHARGHVSHAFFKDAMLGRFYAICNCCACCCGAMQAQRHGVPMLASSGYVAQADEEHCAACGTCAEICPFDAIVVNGHAVVDVATCMGCGVCVSHCPNKVLSLHRDASKSAPLEIETLLATAHFATAESAPPIGTTS